MASREFRNDPRRQNMEKLNKKMELYILETAIKPEAVKVEAKPEVSVSNVKLIDKIVKDELKRPSRLV